MGHGSVWCAALRPTAGLLGDHGGWLGALVGRSRNSLQSGWPMGEVGIRGVWCLHGPGQCSYVDTGVICTSPAQPGPPPARPLATPGHPLRTCVLSRYAKPETPWHDWLSRAPLDTAGGSWTQQTPRAPPRVRLPPPRGGIGRPEGKRNPFTFLDQNSHLPPPQFPTLPFTLLGQNSHPNSPPSSTYDAHLVNRGEKR